MAIDHASRDMHPTASKRIAEDAPQHPAKRMKKTISVAGLFAKKTQLPPRCDDTVRKDVSADDELTAKAKRHPIYLDVKAATAAYSKGEAGSVEQQLEAIHDELAARIDGLDINGKTIDLPGVPSLADIQSMQTHSALCKPLTEDIVTVSVTKSDGTVTRKDVKLGDSIDKFDRLAEDTNVKLTRLVEELSEVNDDIDVALGEYNKVTESLGAAFREKMATFVKDIEAFHKVTVDEIAKARKDDKAHTVEANRKILEFAAALI